MTVIRTTPVVLAAVAVLAGGAAVARSSTLSQHGETGVRATARAAACPSVPTSATVGYSGSGTVAAGTIAAAPVRTVKPAVKKTRHATKRRVAHRLASGPGQMPPFVNKQAADPACVPTPGGAAPPAPAPSPAP